MPAPRYVTTWRTAGVRRRSEIVHLHAEMLHDRHERPADAPQAEREGHALDGHAGEDADQVAGPVGARARGSSRTAATHQHQRRQPEERQADGRETAAHPVVGAVAQRLRVRAAEPEDAALVGRQQRQQEQRTRPRVPRRREVAGRVSTCHILSGDRVVSRDAKREQLRRALSFASRLTITLTPIPGPAPPAAHGVRRPAASARCSGPRGGRSR